MNQLLGVVMCGGQSLRMGTDKGLITIENLTWAQHAYNKLSQLQIPVLVSINPMQLLNYRQFFNNEQLIVDEANIPGPLNGLLSVHKQHPDKDILVLACDMIDMKPATLQQLTDVWLTNPGCDFYAYYHEGFFEPLCAIYTAAALATIKASYLNGTLTRFSLQAIISNGSAKKLRVNDIVSFNNINSRDKQLP